jgi:UDP-N-acetyl-D-mannosaminuronic acid dehydrogenase
MQYQHFRIGGHCLPKDTKIFLQSSKARKSKILAAAMDADGDYKTFRTALEKDVNNFVLLFDKIKN